MKTILFALCLTVAIWFSFVNIAKACQKDEVSWINCFLMAHSLACVITFYLHGWY